MRYFEHLVADIDDYQLRIVENIPKNSFVFIVKNKQNRLEYIPAIFGDTIQACKEQAAEKYGVSMEAWHSKGKYLQSLIATHSGNKPGYTFRIAETKIENGHLFGEAAYLYGFDENAYQKYDYGQNSIEICKEFALREFDVPLDAWREEE